MNQANQRSPSRGATGVQLPVDSRAVTPDAAERNPATITVLRPGWRAKLDDGEFWNRIGLALAVFVLGAVAFRRLLVFQTDRSLTLELEEFFFVASDTAPVVVVLVSLCLLFFRRKRLLALPRCAGAAVVWVPLAVLAAFSLAWANFTGAAELGAPALGLTILSVAVTVRGTAALRVVWLPALYMLFAVPIPAPLLSEIVFQFQLWSADLTGYLLFLFAIPAVVSGDQIFMSDQIYMFIESCSGVRAVMALSMMAIVMLDLFDRRGWHVAIVLLAAPLVAFGLNSARAILLILNPYSAVAAIHNLQGIAILMAGSLLLFMLDGLLARRLKQPRADVSGAASHPTVDDSRSGGRGLWRNWALAGNVLAALAIISIWVPTWDVERLPTGRLQGPNRPALAGFSSRALERQNDRVYMLSVGVRKALHRRYFDQSRGGESWVDIYMAIGDHSTRISTPFSPKTGIPGGSWVLESEGSTSLGLAQPDVAVRQIRNETQRRLVYHWYQGSRGFGDEVFRALFALDQSPFRRPEASVVVRLATNLTDTSESTRRQAEQRLWKFFRASRELRAWAVNTGYQGKP